MTDWRSGIARIVDCDRQSTIRQSTIANRHSVESAIINRQSAMSDFVHLHLHSEYSLLDGACRIEELLDKAVELKMPAMAITEHGNMFSSVIFHDQARKRGINPILGCEVYVAPGDRRTKSGTPGETANHLVLLAETNEGYHNLIKLVSSGYTEGFYYKPRIDKELLAQHSKGLIGLSSCLKGEVATGIRTEQQQKAIAGRGRLSRHPRPRELLPRDAVPGHRRPAGRQHRAAADRQGSRARSRRHQRRPLPARTPTSSRTTSCCASARARRSTTPSG